MGKERDRKSEERVASSKSERSRDRDRGAVEIAAESGSKRDRDRDRDHDRERRSRDKVRSRDRDREKDKDRDGRSKEHREHREHREHGEHKDRHRDRDRKSRDREKRERSKQDEDDDERDVKRTRREDSDGEPRKAPSVERQEEPMEEQRDAEAEQRRLDDEMEKRRRRVQEWQQLRRQKEEEERQRRGVAEDTGELANGKTWTLEGEESDGEDGSKEPEAGEAGETDNGDVAMAEAANGDVKEGNLDSNASSGEAHQEEDEVDPLDAFMNTMVLPVVEKLKAAPPDPQKLAPAVIKLSKGIERNRQPSKKKVVGRILPGEDSDTDQDVGDDDQEDDMEEDDEEFIKRVKKTKAEKLAVVDHTKVQYPPFRKNFYIEVKEIAKMTAEDVASYRKELELKVRGKDVPKPIKTWNQTGLGNRVLDVIKKSGFEKPMPIQVQALPIIMSGRDCIGIAKTGSGKTLAFVLPMLRHIMDQPSLAQGDGPVGLIMAPTRELVQQIYSDIKKFTRVIGLTCVPIYGGSGVAQQISELKRGTEIVVCTPGRMIDILCTSAGKITNLRRVTYLVLDEADRMFDMGFEPQITRIVQNTRPDRQTVLFSATFPRQVEVLARKVLDKPVEIQVGGRSVVNKDITQTVEVRPDNERFLRLLELLGEWYEKGKVLVFVHTQEKCDSLFRELLKSGYPCLSLHGAKDQTDRESTLSDFKSNVCSLLVATSVAARGLDVKDLELVLNYDVPNHYEDYVHRVGRTGRAGRKGFAVTFISPDEDRYAPDLVKALELSEQAIPEDLKKLADDFMAKVKQGSEQEHGSGYGGSGFKFNEEEDEARKAAKKAQAKEYGYEEEDDKSDSESDNEGIRKAGGDLSAQAHAALAAAAKAASSHAAANNPLAQLATPGSLGFSGMGLAVPGVSTIPVMSSIPGVASLVPGLAPQSDGAARAAALAAALNLQHNLAKIQAEAIPEHYEAELEINDFPQHARWKVTHKDALGQISEWTGAAITTRGQYFPAGKVAAPGERKLYLFIEGPTEQSVKKAKAEIKRILEESTSNMVIPTAVQPGKYSVL